MPRLLRVVERKEVADNACPLCGYSPLVQKRGYKEEDAKLVEIKRSDRVKKIEKMISNKVLLNVANKTLGRLQSRKEFEAYAKLHGYKPGWVWYMWDKKKKGRL